MVEKSVKNSIGWCSQSITRLDFSRRYNDIMIILYYDNIIDCQYVDHIIMTSLYCIVLSCITLYCTPLYHAILLDTAVYCVILYYIVIYCICLYDI